jgi:hypothetical protein
MNNSVWNLFDFLYYPHSQEIENIGHKLAFSMMCISMQTRCQNKLPSFHNVHQWIEESRSKKPRIKSCITIKLDLIERQPKLSAPNYKVQLKKK